MIYDAVIVGTGFASSFFLLEYLKHAPPSARVLVLERGAFRDHAWRIKQRRPAEIDHRNTFARAGDPGKDWVFTVGFGGGSNCWWACTPRMLPNDFRLKSLYGVGRDWPVGYDELEPYYQEVEEVMAVSGPSDDTPFPRAKPYPQPPHRFSDPDRLLKKAFPDSFFHMPTARSRVATATRGVCCANGVCFLCPVDAKFTVENGLGGVYRDPRVTLRLGAEALAVETAGGVASGVFYRRAGREEVARGELVALGANGLFNPFLLMRSNLPHPLLGRRLHEQVSVYADVLLDGVDNFQGSTSVTGHGYMLYDGPHRARHAACLIESWNKPLLRPEPSRWRQIMRLKLIFENLPEERNRVEIDAEHPDRPVARFEGHGDYARRALAEAPSRLAGLLAALPVERIEMARGEAPAEAHILGTTVMADDPREGVVDRGLVHHDVRNLLVLGSGAFPTGTPANPSLTIAALSLMAARRLRGGAA